MADPLSLCIKSYRRKKALKRLSQLKENAVREHIGLPPKKSWRERCYISCMASLRKTFCQVFTPCCVLGKGKKAKAPNNKCKRICFPMTYENDVFKDVIGFIFGVIITTILYIAMIFQMKATPLVSSLVCSGLGLFFTLGLAFSSHVRLLILLMIPQFFTSKGRTFLIMYAVILVMTHPVQNFNNNILVMSESATCGQEQAFNQTKELVEAAFSPIAAILKTMKKLLKALQGFAGNIREAFTALQKAISEIAGAMGGILKWLKNIVNVCNHKMGEPYRKCKNAFDTAYHRCRDALGIFKFICEIVNAVSFVCLVCRILDLLCIIASMIKNMVIDKIVSPVKTAIRDIKTMFYFNVTIDYHYCVNMTQSKEYSKVRKDIMKEIKKRLSAFNFLITYMSNFLMFTIIFIVIRAIIYRQKYLTNDRFDNFYLTYKLLEVDVRRQKMGHESIFPLKGKERGRYIATNSLRMVKSEKSKMAKGIVILFIAGCHAGFYLMADYGLWWVLRMMKTQLMQKTNKAVPPHLKMHVQGKGAMADMYKAMISMFDPVSGSKVKLDTAPCLPDPYEPNWKIYDEIGIIFGICLFLSIFESYGLRIRHVICGVFFPRREIERGVWLYNHILHRRGGFLKFARRKMRRDYSTRHAEEKGSLRGKLAARYNTCRKLFKWCGWEKKSCLCCGKEGKKDDNDNFCHCAQGDCQAVYCYECYDDLNNMCTVCMNPIDYGDVSDMSEERDSSDDEDEYLKMRKEAKRRRKEREKKRAENSPSKILAEMGFKFGVSVSEDQQDEEEDNSVDQSKDNDSDEPVVKKAKGGGKDMKEVVLDMEDDVTDKEDNVIDMKEDSLRKRSMKKKENK